MGKRLTVEQRIERFCSHITRRRINTAWKNKDAQCFDCMDTVNGEMVGDALGNHLHLVTHVEENYLTYGVLIHAYREQDEGLTELSDDMIRDIERTRDYVKQFLVKRLIDHKQENALDLCNKIIEDINGVKRTWMKLGE